jgi:predicted ArsR family transcriptional regulator
VLNTPSRASVLGPAPALEPTAVATPAQAEVLAALTAEGPATAAELSARTGQHPNTVREHLDALVGLGLVVRDRDAPVGRGRPAYRYAALPHPTEGPAYRALIAALVEHFVDGATRDPLANSPETTIAQRATALGRQAPLPVGVAELVRASGGGRSAPPARRHVARALATVMTGQGFGAEELPRGHGVRLVRCPLRAVADRHGEVVCGFHHGLLQAVGAVAGADPDSIHLEPFAEPGACLVRIGTLATP